jgi:methyl-galactoside transport system substrate-binding protein
MDDPFMEDYADYLIYESTDKFEITIYNAQNSQIIQNELIEEGLAKKPDLIIVNPVDRLGAYTIIEKVKELDIPIIFMNREPLNSDLDKYDKAYYVGAIASQSGIYQAEIIDDLFGSDPDNLNSLDLNNDNRIQAIIFKGEQGHQDAELRTEYVQKTLLEYGYNLDVLTIQTADWDLETAYQLAIPTLEVYGSDTEIIISNNDWMAIGVIDALVELGYIDDINNDSIIDIETEPWLPVIGIDGIDEGLQKVENGFMYATIINDSQSQARACILLAESIITNTDFQSDEYSLVDEKYIWVDYLKNVKED